MRFGIGGVLDELKSNGLGPNGFSVVAIELGGLRKAAKLGRGGEREESCCSACKFAIAGKVWKFPKVDRFGICDAVDWREFR